MIFKNILFIFKIVILVNPLIFIELVKNIYDSMYTVYGVRVWWFALSKNSLYSVFQAKYHTE